VEVKVVCNCGQKFAFEVEPVNGRMPVSVSCPGCGRDGTQAANDVLVQHFPNQAPPIPVAIAVQPAVAAARTAPVGRLQINLSAPASSGALPPLPAAPELITSARSPVLAAAPKLKAGKEYSLGLGIVGAILGAALGAGLMYGFFVWADFRFPLMGTGIGVLTGLGARILAKGTDITLGAIAGAIAFLVTGGTLYFMFGDVAMAFIISMIVSVSLAFKIAG
jgi:hypothetical protein